MQDTISHQQLGPVTNEKQKKNGVTQADTRVDANEPQWKAGMITTNELRKGERLYSTKILSLIQSAQRIADRDHRAIRRQHSSRRQEIAHWHDLIRQERKKEREGSYARA